MGSAHSDVIFWSVTFANPKAGKGRRCIRQHKARIAGCRTGFS